MIRTLVFDLGKVLIPFDWQRGYEAFARVCPYPPEEVRRRIKEAQVFDAFERGLLAPAEVAERVSAALDMRVTLDEFRALWGAIFLPETLVPDVLLERLHARHRLLLLSNTDSIHFDFVRARYPILRHIDDFVLSFAVGMRKPEAGIYQETIARARCAAGEIFFTDDRADNIEGALACGIDAVQFTTAGQLENDLRARGVAW